MAIGPQMPGWIIPANRISCGDWKCCQQQNQVCGLDWSPSQQLTISDPCSFTYPSLQIWGP